MKTNSVLKQLADRIQAHFASNPDLLVEAARRSRELTAEMQKAVDRMRLLSGIKNLN